MAISLILSSEPGFNGTNRSDFIVASGYANSTDEIFPEALANRIRARGGNDLVIGDIGAIFTSIGGASNGSIATALNLDDVRLWTTDENPLIGDASIPHTTVLGEATAGDKEFFSIALTAGQTITIDLDFGSVIGAGGDLLITLYGPGGALIEYQGDSAPESGGLGSYLDESFPAVGRFSTDPYLVRTVSETGTYYIQLSSGTDETFTRSDTFMMHISLPGHAVYDRTSMGDDVLDGDDGDDVLLGVGGNDVLRGAAGDDVIHGGSGSDRIDGGAGADTLDAGSSGAGGGDTVRGGDGDDLIQVSTSGQFYGDAGDDRMIVPLGLIGVIDGGDGHDTVDLSTLASAWTINLKSGESQLADLHVRNFEDVTFGSGADTVTGSSANEVLRTLGGGDTIDAGAGDDRILPGSGDNSIDGGAGFDIVSFADLLVFGVALSLAISEPQSTGFGTQQLARIEGLIGTSGNDLLIGNESANRLDGAGGTDELTGGGGDDVLVVDGGDRAEGGSGVDTLLFGLRSIGVTVSLAQIGNQPLSPMSGDSIRLNAIENIVGTHYIDTIGGSSENNLIDGGAGDDVLDGGAGADILIGGTGADRLTGGLGRDIFRFFAGDTPVGGGATPDIITDFSRGDRDRIDLSQIDANTTTDPHDSFTFIGRAAFSGTAGELRYRRGDGGAAIFADTDGDGRPDLFIELNGEANLRADDFILAPSAPRWSSLAAGETTFLAFALLDPGVCIV